MKQIIDQFLLLLYCFSAIPFIQANHALTEPILNGFVTALLTAVIYTSCNHYRDSAKFNLFSTLIYAVLSFFFPQMLLFIPAVLYSVLEYRTHTGLAILAVSMFLHFPPESVPILMLILLGCAFSFLLFCRTRDYNNLYSVYREMRDDSAERNLSLKEKNNVLLEKQNSEIYAATLKERNRIAREIHDNVGHMLSRSILMTGAMQAVNKDPVLFESLMQLEDTLNDAMTNVRESVHDLHDESVNLKEALEDLVCSFTFCDIRLDYDMGYDIPRDIKYSYIAIVKEALNNIIRHSNADHVKILVREHPGLYQLAVEDNGTAAGCANQNGIGLKNMEERTKSLGGILQIYTDKGFRIFITVPKKEVIS